MISRLVAAAALGVAGLAGSIAANAAINPTIDPHTVGTPDRFYISGSTAVDAGFKVYFSLNGAGLCKTGTLNIFSDATTLKGATQYMITCQSLAAIGTIPANTNIMVVKDGSGGSLEGTNPLVIAAQQRTDYWNVDQAGPPTFINSCAAAQLWSAVGEVGAGKTYPHGDPNAAFFGSCTAAKTAAITPNVGIADVNAELFTVGLESITASTISSLSGNPIYQQQFGVAVSLNLYRTLQAAQGKGFTDAAVDMPTLSLQTLRGIFGINSLSGTGLTTDWSQVLDDAGNAVTTHDAANANQTAPAALNGNSATQIYVCRRGDSSGTMASQDAYFLQNRCQSGLVPFVTPTTATNTCNGGGVCTAAQCTAMIAAGTSCQGSYFLVDGNPGQKQTCVAGHTYQTVPEETGCTYQTGAAGNLFDIVFAGNGTGDVDKCLHDHSKNNSFAVGILSGDRPYDDLIAGNANAKGGWGGSGDATPAQVTPPQPLNNAASHEWRYVAIGGAKPNLESVAAGLYDDVWNNVVYTGTLGNAAGNNAGPNSPAFQAYISSGTGNAVNSAVVIGDLESSNVQTHGTTGGILEPANTGTIAAVPVNLATNPVSALSKAWVGNNDCQPTIQFNTQNALPIYNRPSGAPAPVGVPVPF